jgi:hypothetical protein
MKGIILVSLILLVGLASAYTPEQQTTLDGMNLSFDLGTAYEQALLGGPVSEYNALVDVYNAWIQKTFGENTGLEKSKLGSAALGGVQEATAPFNTSSELGKFGKNERKVATFTPDLLGQEDYLAQKAVQF